MQELPNNRALKKKKLIEEIEMKYETKLNEAMAEIRRAKEYYVESNNRTETSTKIAIERAYQEYHNQLNRRVEAEVNSYAEDVNALENFNTQAMRDDLNKKIKNAEQMKTLRDINSLCFKKSKLYDTHHRFDKSFELIFEVLQGKIQKIESAIDAIKAVQIDGIGIDKVGQIKKVLDYTHNLQQKLEHMIVSINKDTLGDNYLEEAINSLMNDKNEIRGYIEGHPSECLPERIEIDKKHLSKYKPNDYSSDDDVMKSIENIVETNKNIDLLIYEVDSIHDAIMAGNWQEAYENSYLGS